MAFYLRTSIIDKTFDSNNSSTYKLSIEIGFQNLAFAILDSERNKYLVLENYEIKNCFDYKQLMDIFEGIVAENKKLQINYSSVSVGLTINSSIQIPKPLFYLDSLSSQLDFHRIINGGEKATADFIKSVDTYSGYAVSQELKDAILKKFSNAKIFHYSSFLIDSLMGNFKNEEGISSFIQVQQNCFDLVILINGKLLFYNSFDYKTGEDLVYHLLFAYEQLKLNPESTSLKIIGLIERKSQVYDLIYRYIRKVEFLKKSSSFDYSFTFNDIPEHYYFNLLNQQACEL